MADNVINPNANVVYPQVAAPQGPELDAGKSTVKGATNYASDKGKSVITDADTVVDISAILAQNQKGDIKPQVMADELKKRGYQVELTEVDGKPAIRFQNGDIFMDSSGDGQLGDDDINFDKALGQVEGKFGVNLGGLRGTMSALANGQKLKNEAEKLGEAGLYGYMMGNQNQNAPFAPVAQQDLEELLGEVDERMADAGYQGQEKARDLWRNGRLNEIMTQLGLNLPIPIPRPPDVAYDMAMTRGMGLFGLAHRLAGHLQPA
ncbi:MAG: hypothetical protein HY319_30880 [Armatimonadetes bacterium]|nr:hypothetical protein [Armatimonadota bacterium]